MATRDLAAKYFSVADAEALTGISKHTWRAWAYIGKIASVKTGNSKQSRMLIPSDEVERIMAGGLRPAVTE